MFFNLNFIMKKNFIYLFFVALCTVCAFTSCSSDDDDNTVNKPIVLNDIVGTYDGVLQVMGNLINEELAIEKIDDSHVRVVLDDFSYATVKLGDISADCSAVKSEDATKYKINGTAAVKVAMFGNIELPVEVDGECNGQKLDVTISINDVPVIGALSVEFVGKK